MQLGKHTFCVFDLDDTLYPEVAYVASGLNAVGALVRNLYGRDVSEQLRGWRDEGKQDILGQLCVLLGVPASVRESFIWTYRLHAPAVSLDSGVLNTLRHVESHTAGIAIVTDGRSVSQRQKLASLELLRYPVFISEEYGSDKPDPLRFEMIQQQFDAASYVYVADNPQKDFVAPNNLGWQTIGVRSSGQNIHAQSLEHLPPENAPQEWVDSLEDLVGICAAQEE